MCGTTNIVVVGRQRDNPQIILARWDLQMGFNPVFKGLTCMSIDVAIPGDRNVIKEEAEKILYSKTAQ